MLSLSCVIVASRKAERTSIISRSHRAVVWVIDAKR